MIKKITISLLMMLPILLVSGCEQKTQTKEQNKTITTKAPVQDELIATGDISDGAKLYRDNIQKACNMSGYALARKKSKQEWITIAKNGELAKTIETICPNIKFKNIWTPDIYEYLYKNAFSIKS